KCGQLSPLPPPSSRHPSHISNRRRRRRQLPITTGDLVSNNLADPRLKTANTNETLAMPTVNSNSYVHGNANAPPPPSPATQHYGNQQQYSFQYSQCTGCKKALLIGINYFNQRGQLRGCIHD